MAENAVQTDPKGLKGIHKAAVFLLSLPGDQSKKILSQLDDLEIIELSKTMATLSNVSDEFVKETMDEFINKTTGSGSIGGKSAAEKLLNEFFPKDKVAQIMADLKGNADSMWNKLNKVDEKDLAQYLEHEHPQTVAVILSKIKPDLAAKVFSSLPQEFSVDVMNRSVRMDSIQRDVIDNIEETLKTEFITRFAKSTQKDPHERLAEVFNFFDRVTEGRFMDALENQNQVSAERIRSLMFTFVDMIKLDATGIQTVLRVADKSRLALALKGANEEIKKLFFDNMSERAGKLLKEDMEGLGMVRLKDVDAAQMEIVSQTKELIESGEVQIVVGGEDEQLIG